MVTGTGSGEKKLMSSAWKTVEQQSKTNYVLTVIGRYRNKKRLEETGILVMEYS